MEKDQKLPVAFITQTKSCSLLFSLFSSLLCSPLPSECRASPVVDFGPTSHFPGNFCIWRPFLSPVRTEPTSFYISRECQIPSFPDFLEARVWALDAFAPVAKSEAGDAEQEVPGRVHLLRVRREQQLGFQKDHWQPFQRQGRGPRCELQSLCLETEQWLLRGASVGHDLELVPDLLV